MPPRRLPIVPPTNRVVTTRSPLPDVPDDPITHEATILDVPLAEETHTDPAGLSSVDNRVVRPPGEETSQIDVPVAHRVQRPRTRGDCVDGPRPCPWYSCRFHLGINVNPATGSIALRLDPDQIDQAAETCVLDVADRGGVTLEEIGQLLDLTRERIRQLEDKALGKLAKRGGQELADHLT